MHGIDAYVILSHTSLPAALLPAQASGPYSSYLCPGSALPPRGEAGITAWRRKVSKHVSREIFRWRQNRGKRHNGAGWRFALSEKI